MNALKRDRNEKYKKLPEHKKNAGPNYQWDAKKNLKGRGR
jgi:hypothetical protein